jgi:hypothetical protein
MTRPSTGSPCRELRVDTSVPAATSAGRTRSASTLARIPWERLSPEARAITRQIALPLSMGYSLRETARRIGISVSSADLLAPELRGQSLAARALVVLIAWGRASLDCRASTSRVTSTTPTRSVSPKSPASSSSAEKATNSASGATRCRRRPNRAHLRRLTSPQALDWQTCASSLDQSHALHEVDRRSE